jgi:hypothetical protein
MALGRLGLRRGLRLGGDADLKRIDSYRLGDVLELGCAEIDELEIEPPLDLSVGAFGQADAARLANPLQPGGDVDAVAHEIAVALLDDVAQVNTDPKFDALVGATSALRSTIALWTSIAQFTASTTLRNSMMLPSPVRLTIRP